MTDGPDLAMDLTMPRLTAWVAAGAVVLLGLFIVLALVRYWSVREGRRGKASGGLDLADLKRQRDAGDLGEAEYEAIAARLAGRPPGRASTAAGRHAATARLDKPPPAPDAPAEPRE